MPEEGGAHGGEPPGRRLPPALAVDHPRPHDPRLGMLGEVLHQHLDGSLVDPGVGVEDEEPLAGGPLHGAVHARAEPEVAARAEDRRLGQLRREPLD